MKKTIVIDNSIIVFVATMAPTVAFAAVAELEREYILQCQREGIAIAKTKSQYTGRKLLPLPDNFERVVSRWRAGEITAIEAMWQTRLKPNTEFMENGPEAELDDQLGYNRYDYKNKDTDNSRNGHSSKTLRTSFSDVEVSVPRDRKSEFEPKVLRKNQTSISQDIEDIFIACTDNLTGFSAAIEAVYPKTEIQNCIIHQLRNSSKYVSYKDLKALMADLKAVYAAVDEPAAFDALDTFAEHWDKKYPKISQSRRNNWANLSTYFKFPQALRRLIYTTNTIEGFNRQLRKVTKSKSVFPTDDSLFKMLQHEPKTCKRCTVCAQKRRNSK